MKCMCLSIALLLLATPVTTVAAQETPAQSTECSASGASYMRCALWIDGQRVRRGGEGVVAGRPGFFRPLRLTPLVQGDSAVHYARGFERNTARAGGFALLSAALVLGASIAGGYWDCDGDITLGTCSNNDDWMNGTTAGLLLGGLVSGIVSSVFQHHARRDASRAVFWHNSNFAR